MRLTGLKGGSTWMRRERYTLMSDKTLRTGLAPSRTRLLLRSMIPSHLAFIGPCVNWYWARDHISAPGSFETHCSLISTGRSLGNAAMPEPCADCDSFCG